MSPLLWLFLRSFRNRLASKLGKLRQPRYVLSMLAFTSYLAFVLFVGSGPREGPAPAGASLLAAETGVLAFLILSGAGPWLLPGPSTALAFSMAEVQNLFPAPIPRSALLRMKILNAQPAILVSALVFVFATRSASSLRALSVFVGALAALELLFLNRLAAHLSRIPAREGATFRPARLAGKLAWLAVIAGLALSFRALHLAGLEGRFLDGVGAWWHAAPARFVLLPLRLVAAPVLAQDPASLARTLVPVLSFLAILYVLVVHREVPFEEEGLQASESLFRRLDTFRRTGRLAPATGKVDPAPWPLRPRGSPILALTWKNLLAASRTPLWRLGLYVVLLLGGAGLVTRFPETAWAAPEAAPIVAGLAGFLTFLGPDLMRFDLRTSLQGADFLKTLPLPGWAVVLGEILAPALATLFFQAVLLGTALVLWAGERGFQDAGTYAWLWLGLVTFLAPLDLLLFVIANGAALLFPAWVPLGPRPQRGGEAFGMNLLLQLARLVLLTVGLVPAGSVAAVLGFLAWRSLGPAAFPLAALAGALVVLVEVGALTWLLGRALERLDPSADLAATN